MKTISIVLNCLILGLVVLFAMSIGLGHGNDCIIALLYTVCPIVSLLALSSDKRYGLLQKKNEFNERRKVAAFKASLNVKRWTAVILNILVLAFVFWGTVFVGVTVHGRVGFLWTILVLYPVVNLVALLHGRQGTKRDTKSG